MGYRSGWSQQLRDYVANKQATVYDGSAAAAAKKTAVKKSAPKKKWHWIDDDRVPSQAEINYYTALDAGETPKITQAHLDEIGVGEGGEGLTVDDVGPANEPNPEEEPVEMPGFTSEHNPYIDPLTGEKKFQTREEWSASIDDDATSVGPTDTTENALAGGSLMTGGKSSSSSIGGGYGRKRVGEMSRKQMHLTGSRNRSILTS